MTPPHLSTAHSLESNVCAIYSGGEDRASWDAVTHQPQHISGSSTSGETFESSVNAVIPGLLGGRWWSMRFRGSITSAYTRNAPLQRGLK